MNHRNLGQKIRSNRTKRKGVNVFLSYSHRDRQYFEELRRVLKPLEDEGVIRQFYDRQIVPGTNWSSEIDAKLGRAKIVLLLISGRFLASEHCKAEMEHAVRMGEENDALVVPIILEDVEWKTQGIAKFQALPSDGLAINRWPNINEAWTNVAEGLRLTIDYLTGDRPVNEMITGSEQVLSEAEDGLDGRALTKSVTPTQFDSVTEFWKEQGSRLGEVRLASIKGTFSSFGPMLIGPPDAKRLLHREFRLALERYPDFAAEKLPTVNACMSVSSGQMVWRFRKSAGSHLYFGLYESIVRNSVPIFVTREYCERNLTELSCVDGACAFEATILGKVIKLNNSHISRFLRRRGLTKYIPSQVARDLSQNVFGLLVDGNQTSVQRMGKPRYLDGDIWIAVETGGVERFVSTFVNISDPSRFIEAHALLKSAIGHLEGPITIIAEYDQAGVFSGKEFKVASGNARVERLFRSTLGIS